MKSNSLLKSMIPTAVGLAFAPAALLADTITMKGATPVDVTINRFENGELYYTSNQSGRESHRSLDVIVQIQSDTEKKLSQAEQDFNDKKWEAAVSDYQGAINATQQEWVRVRSIKRLLDAAGNSKQFLPLVSAFVEDAKIDVADAKKRKPDLTGIKADQLKLAESIVERGTQSAKSDAYTTLMLFDSDLKLARGDNAGSSAILQKLTPGSPQASASGGVQSSNSGGSTDVILAAAKANLGARQYDKVIGSITASRASFTDPSAQAEALYYLAEAKAGTARTDADRQDAAIAYLRLVAHFEGKPEGGNVGSALMKAAQLEEQLKQPNEALQIYEHLSTDARYKGTPIAGEAGKRVAVLRGS